MKGIMLLIGCVFFFGSCSVDEEIIPLVGIYRAHVVGVAGPFDLVVSTDRGDNVLIDATFDGFAWSVIQADIDNKQEELKDVDIRKQEVYPGSSIQGDGFYYDGTLELTYCIRTAGDCETYKIVAVRR